MEILDGTNTPSSGGKPVTEVTLTLDQQTLQTLQMGLAALQINAATAAGVLTKAVEEALKRPVP